MTRTLVLAAFMAAALSPWPVSRTGVAAAPDACQKLAPATADTAALSVWRGTFLLNPRESDDLDAVAKRAASGMGRLGRGQAQDRIRERLRPAECLRLTDDGAWITIESERGVMWRVDRNGSVQAGAGRGNGSGRTLGATVSDESIAITGSGQNGEGRYRLTRGDAGERIKLAVSLEARRLNQPLKYTLVYDRRQADQGS